MYVYSYGVCEHGPHMRGECQRGEPHEYEWVDGVVQHIVSGQDDHAQHHKHRVQDQEPREYHADYTADVLQYTNYICF